MPTRRCSLPVPAPFDLAIVLAGHGWYSLPPHRWEGGTAPFRTVLRLGDTAVDATVTAAARGLAIQLDSATPLGDRDVAAARKALGHMLRLDDDLAAFWRLCAAHPQLRWVAHRGAGRLLRSATVFEDLLKLLLTTNTTWAGTTAMLQNVVRELGRPAPSGERAFPTPAECPRDERFWRDRIRVGYRAKACIALAERFANGELTDDQFLAPQPIEALRARLHALHGFGPYAAGQAMRLFGHYEDLALDSWCRARVAELQGRKRPPSDRAIGRLYRAFGPFAGLALWCDLTANWFGVKVTVAAAGRKAAAHAAG